MQSEQTVSPTRPHSDTHYAYMHSSQESRSQILVNEEFNENNGLSLPFLPRILNGIS